MYIATFKNEEDHKFDVHIDVDDISTVETATNRSQEIVREVFNGGMNGYIFLDIKEVTLEQFYHSKGRDVEEEIPVTDDTEEVVDIENE